MTNKEAIDTIKHAISEVEWTYPMDYAAAFDKAVEALELVETSKPVEPERHCECGNGLKTDEIIRAMRIWAEQIQMPGRHKLLTEAADRLEELDERVAIIDADWSEAEKDLAIIGECRTGKVKKFVGRGLVILNYQWWRERIEKTGFRAVPTDEDMEGAEHDRREGKTDRAD